MSWLLFASRFTVRSSYFFGKLFVSVFVVGVCLICCCWRCASVFVLRAVELLLVLVFIKRMLGSWPVLARAFVVSCNEMLLDLFHRFQRITFKFIPLPSEDVGSVSAMAICPTI